LLEPPLELLELQPLDFEPLLERAELPFERAEPLL
jgi:hypothetical protein